MQEVSAKLGPILNLGEMIVPKPQPSADAAATNKSSEKYATNSNDASEAYKRESSVASASAVGMDGRDRSFTPGFNRSETSHSEMIKKKFGDF